MFTGLINCRGFHLSHIWTIHLYWDYICFKFFIRFIVFFQFSLCFSICQKLCWMRGLCISFTSLCFFVSSRRGGLEGLRTGRGEGLKNFRTGRVTSLGGTFAGGGSVPHYMPCIDWFKFVKNFVKSRKISRTINLQLKDWNISRVINKPIIHNSLGLIKTSPPNI